ncbi:MAG TPA: RAxF-45 family protein [Lentibacillus sp.]|nr:RAxF-45 family protein [Lentibacillus sp.]HLR60986.1 RAxF-45 family protein [Lentibacillus sp.]
MNFTGSGIDKFREYLWICYALFSDVSIKGIRMSFFKIT